MSEINALYVGLLAAAVGITAKAIVLKAWQEAIERKLRQ